MQNRAAMRFLRVESAAFKIYRRCRLFLPRSNLLLSIMSSKNPKSCSLGSRQTFTHLGVVFQKGCNCLGVNTYHVERSVIQMTCFRQVYTTNRIGVQTEINKFLTFQTRQMLQTIIIIILNLFKLNVVERSTLLKFFYNRNALINTCMKIL
jgi:hypothetical protein